MIENEMAKLENPDQDRFSSCLYPSSARSCSSEPSFSPWCSSSSSDGSIPSGIGVLFPLVAMSAADGNGGSNYCPGPPRD